MLNYKKAVVNFNNFTENYDMNNNKINTKIEHTFNVVNVATQIALDLNLCNEDIELAKLIALLHDIGRFDQAIKFNNFVDSETIDHADYAVQFLFEGGNIRKFIKTNKYDNIIKEAIKNHNKFELRGNLSLEEQLHSKLLRDADKTDIFRIKTSGSLKEFTNGRDYKNIENDNLSDEVFNSFLNNKTVLSPSRVTALDMWISTAALIFDYNFDHGLKIVKDKNYINKVFDRIDYKNMETKEKILEIKEISNNYLEKRTKDDSKIYIIKP